MVELTIEEMPGSDYSQKNVLPRFALDAGAYIQTAGPDIFNRFTRKPIKHSDWTRNNVVPRVLKRASRFSTEKGLTPVIGIMRYDDDRFERFSDLVLGYCDEIPSDRLNATMKEGLLEVNLGQKQIYFVPSQKILTSQGPVVALGNKKIIGNRKDKTIEEVAKEIHDQGALIISEGELYLNKSGLVRKLTSAFYLVVNKNPNFTISGDTFAEISKQVDALGLNPMFYEDSLRTRNFSEESGDNLVVVSGARQPEALLQNYVLLKNLDTSNLRSMVSSINTSLGEIEDDSIVFKRANGNGFKPMLSEVLPIQLGLKSGIFYRR